MARDIRKAVAEYVILTDHGKKHGTFYISDGEQIIDMATRNGHIDLHTVITLALEAGYTIGYRTAKRHSKGDRGKHEQR